MEHFLMLQAHMRIEGWPMGGGSYLMNGKTLDYDPVTFAKQELYYNTVKNLKPTLYPTTAIIEIGVYAGHSALIALMANPDIEIFGVDTCYEFTDPCVSYLRGVFNNRIRLYTGDSHEVLPTWEQTWEMAHVDGNHDPEHIKKDIELLRPLIVEGGIIVLDDFDGILASMKDWVNENFHVLEVADCPNPNAICKFK